MILSQVEQLNDHQIKMITRPTTLSDTSLIHHSSLFINVKISTT